MKLWPRPRLTRQPNSTLRTAPGSADPAAADTSLHACAQCGYTIGLLDEHWLTVTGTNDLKPRVTVCTPRCAVLWLEATYRPTQLGVAR